MDAGRRIAGRRGIYPQPILRRARNGCQGASGGGTIRALLVNTGCANAGTGEDGFARARQTCAEVAALLGCEAEQVLPFSTGVIMEPLPVDRIAAGLPRCVADLGEVQLG